MTATIDATRWDPRDLGFRADPYPWYRALREQSPVHRHADVGYVISRYADIEALLRDDRFSVSTPSPWRELLAEHGSPALRMLGESTLLFVDAADRTRVRALVAKAFTPRHIALLRPHIGPPSMRTTGANATTDGSKPDCFRCVDSNATIRRE